MIQAKEIREAMLRLSSIGLKRYEYDQTGQILGEGQIHYLVEVSDLLFIAWENSDTCLMIVNPITCFSLDELEELGFLEAWMFCMCQRHWPRASSSVRLEMLS